MQCIVGINLSYTCIYTCIKIARSGIILRIEIDRSTCILYMYDFTTGWFYSNFNGNEMVLTNIYIFNDYFVCIMC